MKTSERRNRIILLYIVLILGFFALGRVSRAGFVAGEWSFRQSH